MKKFRALNITALILLFCSSFLFLGCSEDSLIIPDLAQGDQAITAMKNGTKPAPNLVGQMELYFMLTAVSPDEPVWDGTVDFEGIGSYGMRFYHLSPFKGYSQADPFEEYFEVYDLTDGTIYLGGPDSGVTSLANKIPEPTKYRMNGKIDVAAGPFESWLGRKVHMSGVITWQFLTLPDGAVIVVPGTAPGEFRIN